MSTLKFFAVTQCHLLPNSSPLFARRAYLRAENTSYPLFKFDTPPSEACPLMIPPYKLSLILHQS